MNIESYIESGTLEAYVGGFLSDAENKAVDEMAAKYPQVKEEIEKIQESLRIYAQQDTGALQPPSLDSILAQVDDIEETPEQESVIKTPTWTTYLLAASIALLILSTYFIFTLYQESQEWKQKALSLETRNAYVEQQYQTLTQNPQVIEPHQHIVEDPASIPVVMTGQQSAPQSKVHVFWHSTSKDVYLVIDKLPEPPDGHQYQLWAIVNGTSLDAGIFDHHTKMQKLKHIEGNVSAFAVTLEEKGGSPIPRLDRIYAKGDVKES